MLSFLLPSVEEALQRRHVGEFILGREASMSVREQARRTYLTMVARLGAVPAGDGRTLREMLARPGQASRWWYHLLSFKDCEVDSTFEWLIALFTIVKVAQDRHITHIALVGAPSPIAAVLKQAFVVSSRGAVGEHLLVHCVRSLASRAAFAIRSFYICWLMRRYRAKSSWVKIEFAFSGFWSWSVWSDDAGNAIADRYFGDLPQKLAASGRRVGWLGWLDKSPPMGRRYTLCEAARSAERQNSIFMLQSTLRWSEILKAVIDIRPLTAALTVWHRSEFRTAFQSNGLNLFPLFKRSLLSGVLDAGIPLGELVALATERACRRFQPLATFSFLEHVPYARAHYEGAKRASPTILNYLVQHGRYSIEKTFLFLDPELEFRGRPDGYPVPHPDYVLAMGTYFRGLFLECGYDRDHVVVTGSPRYERVRIADLPEQHAVHVKKDIRLLIIGGVRVSADLEMIDAACHAAKAVPGLRIEFRKHPLNPVENVKACDQVRMTTSGLDEDLEGADIVLFSYSTVAEDAALLGRPVWQWLSPGVSGCALSDVASIPCFCSAASLREALIRFRANPSRYAWNEADRRQALLRIFHAVDGRSADRVASFVTQAMARSPVAAHS